jgi:diadenosine tetraphosphate (Ap4A) HIT family hydrolase
VTDFIVRYGEYDHVLEQVLPVHRCLHTAESIEAARAWAKDPTRVMAAIRCGGFEGDVESVEVHVTPLNDYLDWLREAADTLEDAYEELQEENDNGE